MIENSLILVIDDDQIVHRLLTVMLKKADYELLSAYSGEDGLRLAAENTPSLILLDIMMPKMNGFEVMTRLKENHITSEIPVIFLSAKVETTDKVRGLELGASDFVTKPFEQAELLARIKTHLKLKAQEDALKEYSNSLKQVIKERTKQLIHADRLVSLGTLSAGIAHEINNPATFITGNVQMLDNFWEKMAVFVERHLDDSDSERELRYILKECPAVIQSIRSGADRIARIVAGLRNYARKGSSIKELVNVDLCLEEAQKLTHYQLKYAVEVEKRIDPELPPVFANFQQLTQVFANLFINSADAIGDKKGRIIINGLYTTDGMIKITFFDDGGGIPIDIQSKIFDPFFTTKPTGQGTGLGLSITQNIIAEHDGAITVESEPGKGTTFTIILPTEKHDE